MRDPAGRTRLRLAPLVALVLVATLAINFLSAFIRHGEAGLGCADRPACYGQIGASIAAARESAVARHALAPDPVAKRTHRALATALVVMVLLLLHRSRQGRELTGFESRLPLLMAALLLLLAVIGPASYLKTLPAIAACNLLGGIALAALGWRLLLGVSAAPKAPASPALRHASRAALALLALQIALGAWTSANFAGFGCRELAGCGAPPPAAGESVLGAFWYFRELGLDANGRVLHTTATTAIHLAHRAGAVLAAVAIALACARAWRERVPARLVLPVLLLLLAQLGLGVAAVAGSLPFGVVLAHSSVATLLLLALLRLDHALQPAGAERRT